MKWLQIMMMTMMMMMPIVCKDVKVVEISTVEALTMVDRLVNLR